jgi:hypothetical protein
MCCFSSDNTTFSVTKIYITHVTAPYFDFIERLPLSLMSHGTILVTIQCHTVNIHPKHLSYAFGIASYKMVNLEVLWLEHQELYIYPHPPKQSIWD